MAKIVKSNFKLKKLNGNLKTYCTQILKQKCFIHEKRISIAFYENNKVCQKFLPEILSSLLFLML